MSIQTEVLYGNRLYDKVTYSTNNDPESLSLSLSDSTSVTDSTTAESATKALAETITFTESLITSGIKALSDSTTMTETFIKKLSHAFSDTTTLSDAMVIRAIKVLSDAFVVTDSLIIKSSIKALSDTVTLSEQRLFQLHSVLADSLSILDNTVVIRATKGLTDFIILNDWLSVILDKANIWATQSAQHNTGSENVLYDVPEYNQDLYSVNPVTTWRQGTEASALWVVPPEHEIVLPLYSQILYSQSLFGSMPTVVWGNNVPIIKENFTNVDGEGNVP